MRTARTATTATTATTGATRRRRTKTTIPEDYEKGVNDGDTIDKTMV